MSSATACSDAGGGLAAASLPQWGSTESLLTSQHSLHFSEHVEAFLCVPAGASWGRVCLSDRQPPVNVCSMNLSLPDALPRTRKFINAVCRGLGKES